jgi:endonuclease/exonuclease/phosphatase (EEP) superfamily protein YafD
LFRIIPQNTSIQQIMSKSSTIRTLVLKLASLFHAGVFLALAGSLIGYFGSTHFFLDLFSNFRLSYAAALALGFILALFTRKPRLACLWAVGFIMNAVPIVPFFVPPDTHTSPTSTPLRIMFVNVLRKNPDKQAVISAILKANPDVIVAVEVDDIWGNALTSGLASQWPHSKVADRSDNFGIAIFSRQPLLNINIFESPGNYVASLRAELQSGSHTTVIYGTHPFPPMSSFTHSGWQVHMDDLANRILNEKEPVILVGDFNSTPWSANYRWFMKRTGLVDSQKGFGPQSSWPTELPYLGIPIDHIVTSPDVTTISRKIGGHNGSDHRPVIADLMIP